MSSRLRLRTIAVAAVALGLVAGSATVASAAKDGAAEDPRAVAHDGNVTMCEQIGLEGDGILLSYGDGGEVENSPGLVVEGGQPNGDQYLSITDVPDHITVTAVVVKGGPRYNVYVPGENGLSAIPPWNDLRAPLNNGGNIPAISHWFACGTEAPTEEESDQPEPTSKPEEPGDGSGTSEPSTPGEPTGDTETTPAESETSATTPTSSSGATVPGPSETEVSPAGENDDLASTGFSGGWLIGLGAALLLGGGVLLALTRIRRGKA